MKIKFECARLKAQKNSKHDFDEITKEKFIDELNSRLYEDYDSFVSIP